MNNNQGTIQKPINKHKKIFSASTGTIFLTLICTLFFSARVLSIPQPCQTIHYAFINQTNDIYNLQEHDAVRSAMQAWSDTINIQFVEATSQASADLLISWDTAGHIPAQYSGSKFANTTSFVTGISVGTISFNDHWDWTMAWQSGPSGIRASQKTLAMRYIGIALAMSPSPEPASVLHPVYSGSKAGLSFKDKDGARKYYSQCSQFGHYRRGRTEQNLHSSGYIWSIDNNDSYLSGRFIRTTHSDLHGTKNNGQGVLLWESSNNWLLGARTQRSASSYLSVANTIYTVGDFDGDGFDEILYARPGGTYGTLKMIRGGSSAPNAFVHIQQAFNGNIHIGDRLIAGDFDGDGKDNVILIKANRDYYTMEYNTQAGSASWNIIEQGSNAIYWWNINPYDRYVSGDFDGDGKDELLASTPYGWHHTMGFNNNGLQQWSYEAGSGAGSIGGANLGSGDILLSGDFTGNGRDEILFINPIHSWSLLLGLSTGQWPKWSAYSHNAGSNEIGNWQEALGDGHLVGDFDGNGVDELFIYNGDDWQIIEF